MGNLVSCASSTVPCNAVKVIKISGGVQEFRRKVKAAELMLDHPQHCVCHASGLQIGRRVNPLPADEDLEMGQLYLLLPMSKLSSVLTATDMAAIGFWTKGGTAAAALAASAAGAKNAARILPFPPHQDRRKDSEPRKDKEDEHCQLHVPKLSLDDVPDVATALAQLRLGSCRAWRPKLETIRESRPKLRDLMLSNEQFC
eukprot:TRINITY_DN1102_c0_g1_i1.p1 TRINITY_DN1102_c0_g1~~TRINITY_DN1102_c0_g1_i1.p1  ORF type:complete len:200 (+),score=14.38 TRINITY_DN1102_c0_g1_i1:831-1430(+)